MRIKRGAKFECTWPGAWDLEHILEMKAVNIMIVVASSCCHMALKTEPDSGLLPLETWESLYMKGKRENCAFSIVLVTSAGG